MQLRESGLCLFDASRAAHGMDAAQQWRKRFRPGTRVESMITLVTKSAKHRARFELSRYVHDWFGPVKIASARRTALAQRPYLTSMISYSR